MTSENLSIRVENGNEDGTEPLTETPDGAVDNVKEAENQAENVHEEVTMSQVVIFPQHFTLAAIKIYLAILSV